MKNANGVFVQMYPVWRNHNISKGVKIQIFSTNVKSVLLYGCETWKTTNQITRILQTFINECLRQIMNIKWTDKITNEELRRIAKQKPIEIRTKRRKCNCIGHTLCKEAGAIQKTALDWNPQEYRRRGRPNRMW
jgi:translation initiation factor 6 (eIF-6)